jgi:hypothetical protein
MAAPLIFAALQACEIDQDWGLCTLGRAPWDEDVEFGCRMTQGWGLQTGVSYHPELHSVKLTGNLNLMSSPPKVLLAETFSRSLMALRRSRLP